MNKKTKIVTTKLIFTEPYKALYFMRLISRNTIVLLHESYVPIIDDER